jgi:hypothetical protein
VVSRKFCCRSTRRQTMLPNRQVSHQKCISIVYDKLLSMKEIADEAPYNHTRS